MPLGHGMHEAAQLEEKQRANRVECITGVGFLSEEHGLIALPKPNRHGQLYALGAFLNISIDPGDHGGFVTNLGRYISREEAFKMTGKGRAGKTYSEDLW